MKRLFVTVAAFTILALPVMGQHSQLVGSAGLTPAEAEGLSLTEIAAAKFNRDTRRDDAQVASPARQPVMVDPARHAQLIATTGLSPEEARGMTLNELSLAKHNSGAGRDEKITTSARQTGATPAVYFVRSSGLDPEAARGMSLNEVYAVRLSGSENGPAAH